MDELEFRKHVYNNPEQPGEQALAAAADNPAYQAILDRARDIEREVSTLVSDVNIPAGLHQRLLQIPDQDDSASTSPAVRKSTRRLQYLAAAACAVLTLGVLFGIARQSLPGGDMLAGEVIIDHLYLEEAELDAVARGSLDSAYTLSQLNRVLANAGTAMSAGVDLQATPVRFANPCLIMPGYQSAHLILQTPDGPVNVIVINNSPVAREVSIGDERFSGSIIPMPRGNVIVVGESGAALNRYRNMITDNLQWLI